VIRLRETVAEIERVKDHVLIVCHRPVCRVLITYFMDLTRNSIAIADLLLHVPIHGSKILFRQNHRSGFQLDSTCRRVPQHQESSWRTDREGSRLVQVNPHRNVFMTFSISVFGPELLLLCPELWVNKYKPRVSIPEHRLRTA
jgi:hypothetical protein